MFHCDRVKEIGKHAAALFLSFVSFETLFVFASTFATLAQDCVFVPDLSAILLILLKILDSLCYYCQPMNTVHWSASGKSLKRKTDYVRQFT